MKAAFRLFPAIFVAIAATVAFAGPVSARQQFPAEGGRGDASNSDECPRGWYVIGFKGRAGNWIDQISITCARFNADSSIAETRSLPARGGNTGGPSEITCPRGHVVQQASYYMTQEAKQVMQVNAQCRPLSGGNPMTVTFGSRDTFDTKGWGVGDSRQTKSGGQSCHANEAATGFQVNYGRHVNALGLICDELTLPKPVTQAAPPPSPGPGGRVIGKTGRGPTSGGSGAGLRKFESNTDRPGKDYANFDLQAADPNLCQAACQKDQKCAAWTFVRPNKQGPKARCWLKTDVPAAHTNDCCTSGVVDRFVQPR